MVILKNIVLLAGCFVFAACSLGMNDLLGRTTSDPFTEIPHVQSFNGDFSIVINWSRDEAADEYCLYRAADDLYPYYQLIYSGPLTMYRDVFTLPQEENLYLYRLGKRRGQKLFVDLATRGRAALGVVSSYRVDFHEPNNNRQRAVLLDDIRLTANSWYYCSNTIDGISIYNEDWYYIPIPSHWFASIILYDYEAIKNSADNHFRIDIYGEGIDEIIHEKEKGIPNKSNYPDKIYFRIFPNYGTFVLKYAPPFGGAGYGKFITYNIWVEERRPGI